VEIMSSAGLVWLACDGVPVAVFTPLEIGRLRGLLRAHAVAASVAVEG
jgi:hypothetical protein